MQTIPICSPCQIGMRPHHNGVTVIETAHNPPVPYRLWCADEWMCPVCGATVIVGFSERSRMPSRERLAFELEHLDMVRLWKENGQPIDAREMLERGMGAEL